MFLVVEEGVWRDVEEVNVGVVRGFYESILEKNVYYCREKKLTTNIHARRPGRLRSWSGPVDPEFRGRLRFT